MVFFLNLEKIFYTDNGFSLNSGFTNFFSISFTNLGKGPKKNIESGSMLIPPSNPPPHTVSALELCLYKHFVLNGHIFQIYIT